MSVEALAAAWARREDAPDGAVVIARAEIAGRLRGGEPSMIGGDDALLIAVVTRPEIDPMHEALLWLPASLAADEALGEAGANGRRLRWPDRIVRAGFAVPLCAVNVVTQLGPGRVDHSVVSLRVDKRTIAGDGRALQRDDVVIERFVAEIRRHLVTLRDDPAAVLDAYAERCDLIGERVRVELMPRGEARGRVAAVDAEGFLVVESSTGMLDRVPPSTLRSLEILGSGGSALH